MGNKKVLGRKPNKVILVKNRLSKVPYYEMVFIKDFTSK